MFFYLHKVLFKIHNVKYIIFIEMINYFDYLQKTAYFAVLYHNATQVDSLIFVPLIK